jgi:tetratricopeptide (TPR) repeat protein
MMDMAIADLGADLGDFAETAAAMANLDLLISVDTAAAHLAGAMGLPVLLLLPYCADWRWLVNRNDSPWYPTMRLFRQQRSGVWTEPVADVCRALNAHIDRRAAAVPSMAAGRPAAGPVQAVSSPPPATGHRPDLVAAWYDLGRRCQLQGDRAAAARAYIRVLTLAPDFAPALNNLGVLFENQSMRAQAEACYARAIASDPGLASAHNNWGKLWQHRGNNRKACRHFRLALEACPDFAEAVYNLGCSLLGQGKTHQAVEMFSKAIALKSDFADAFNNMGTALREAGRIEEAQNAFRRAIDLQPDLAESHWNLALVRLLQGDYGQGFAGYEWRWRKANQQGIYPHRYPLPSWDGAPFGGKRLYVHDEQGYGDVIQFARFLPLVKARGGTVIFETRPALLPLFSAMAGIDALVARKGDGTPAAACDLIVPLMSLPGRLAATLETIPHRVPYLGTDSARLANWRIRLPAGRFRVGLVWAGRSTRPDEPLGLRLRSLPLARLMPLLRATDAVFIGLQQGEAAGQIRQLPPLLRFDNIGPELKDFGDTAAVLAHLDLLISVDTAAAHLAGALGRPVWVLLSFAADWRWLIDRSDSPWYPTMRLFRQPQPGNWAAAVESVAQALAGLVGKVGQGEK